MTSKQLHDEYEHHPFQPARKSSGLQHADAAKRKQHKESSWLTSYAHRHYAPYGNSIEQFAKGYRQER